jgi:tRNA A-37 threonylcarbamoyl transferase component Bud32
MALGKVLCNLPSVMSQEAGVMNNTVKPNTCPKCSAPIPADAPQGLCPKCVMAGAAAETETGLPPTATSEIPSLERVAASFPQLDIIELIGRGGMGFVFKARQPSLNRLVALKLLPDKLARDPKFTERFNREGRVLGRLNHPNIVSIYDFGQTGGFYFLLMEYVDGVNLRQAMQAGRFSPGEALAIVPKVCEALQYAHEQGVLHRDIKPENILLDARGRVKIADFGIAKLVDDSPLEVTLTGTGAALGTPHYMAPEQLEKPSTVDHRADIYSLGVVFYEMLTGELPIGRFAAPSAKTPVAASVDEVVFRTLEKEPAKRFQSAGEVQTRVQDLAEEANAAAGRGVTTPFAGARSGPHGTVVLGDAAPIHRPAESPGTFSRWSIYGALLVGLSLPGPLMVVVTVLTGLSGIGHGELWLALGSVAMPGLGGTLLGWLGLNEIREARPRVRGLPLAMFATLMWPLAIIGGLAVGIPMMLLVPAGEPASTHTLGRFLVLLLPAGVITFAFWVIHATARWASQQTSSHRSGILKWVFLSLLVTGIGVVLVTKPVRQVAYRIDPPSVGTAPDRELGMEAAPMIQFTFTGVELRDEAGARWLAMDYVEQTRGDCERTFRYDSRITGFTPQTRIEAFRTDGQAGFAPVIHQRALWKLPGSLLEADVLELRDRVTKQWAGKSVALQPGDERLLFTVTVPDGGTLSTAIGVKLIAADPGQPTTVKQP